MLEDKKVIELTTKTVANFDTGYLEGGLGFKFRTKLFLDVAYLYINQVDTKNPDLLGKKNKNTQIDSTQDARRKIKEQIAIDLKDINFGVNGASTLSRYVVKSANRKVQKDNTMQLELKRVKDNGVDFGSGYLQVWKDGTGKQKLKSIDPFHLIFDQHNFSDGVKARKFKRTVAAVLADGKYISTELVKLLQKYPTPEDQEKYITLYQVLKPNTKGGNDIFVVDTENKLVYFKHENDTNIKILKWDYEERRGFPDALGVGVIEQMFNLMVQDKLGRARLEEVMAVAATLPLQKKIDHETDNLVGKEMTKAKTATVMGYKENPIEPMNLGGEKQVAFITQQLAELGNLVGQRLNTGDALQGNTLPSGTSGALGNLLTENASSVHKEVQKTFSQFISRLYDDVLSPYILSVFDKLENIEKYLDPNDIRLVRENVIDYLTLLKQIEASIAGEDFNVSDAREEVKEEIKGKDLISGDLLEQLKSEVKGIETFIAGEKKSKAQTVAFLRDLRTTYLTNPEAFSNPFFVELIKKEAEHENGISGIEIDNLLKELEQ